MKRSAIRETWRQSPWFPLPSVRATGCLGIAIAAGLLSLATPPAHAGGPEQHYGKWHGQARGHEVVAEFDANTVVLTETDASGKPVQPRRNFTAGYATMGSSPKGYVFSVYAKEQGGPYEGTLIVFYTDATDHISLTGAGLSVSDMERVKAP